MDLQTSSVTKSTQDCASWMQRVHDAQRKRTPEAVASARQKYEQSRQHVQNVRKCKAVKSHALRSKALATESLRQMATSAPEEATRVQERWQSAQLASKARQDRSYAKRSMALAPQALGSVQAEVMSDAEASDEEAAAEVAQLVGASDAGAMMAVAIAPVAPAGFASGIGSTDTVQSLLGELRREPASESECSAKFMLYEGYASEVEQMRSTLFKFYEESGPSCPPVIAAGMRKEIKGIDTAESMGIPDDSRDWFVYHMMRQAERNNTKMASILDGFEKKLEFLASNDQNECPVCLEAFEEDGARAPETLSCCHKVCKDCWEHWSAANHGRPFCPLCRHDEFLGAVAAQAVGGVGGGGDFL